MILWFWRHFMYKCQKVGPWESLQIFKGGELLPCWWFSSDWLSPDLDAISWRYWDNYLPLWFLRVIQLLWVFPWNFIWPPVLHFVPSLSKFDASDSLPLPEHSVRSLLWLTRIALFILADLNVSRIWTQGIRIWRWSSVVLFLTFPHTVW